MLEIITDKLFAHIHNDPYLVGSRKLEGENFRHTTSYLQKYVQYLQSKRDEIQDREVLDKIEPLISKIEYLNENSGSQSSLNSKIEGLTEAELLEDQYFKKYTAELAKDVIELSNEANHRNSLMIEGGWRNSDGGHAMVYEFRRNNAGELLFIIHNSGAGINYHHCVSTRDKERFCPFDIYKIKQSNLQVDRLTWFIGELTKPNLNIKGKKDVTPEYLYKSVLTKIAFLDGELEDPIQYAGEESLIGGQRSGICAQKVLHVMLKTAFLDKAKYRNFIYGFRKYALDDYLAAVKSTGRENEAGVANQILLAVENMSKMLLKEEGLDELRKQQELVYLNGVKAYIESKKSLASVPDKKSVDLEVLVSHSQNVIFGLKMPPIFHFSEVSAKAQKYIESKIQVEERFDFQESNFIKALKSFNHKMEMLAAQDVVSTQQSIEKFLIKLTDDLTHIKANFDGEGETERKQELVELLSVLNRIYIGAYRATNKNRLTTQFFVAEMCFLLVLSSIESVDRAEGAEHTSSMLELMQLLMKKAIQQIPKRLEFSSEEYLYDKKLLELVDNLTGNKSVPNRYSAIKCSVKSLYEKTLAKHQIYDGLADYYSHYCEALKLKDSEKVIDKGELDMRSLFMMQKYFERNDDAKIQFIEDYCRSNRIDDDSNILLSKERFRLAEADFRLQNSLEQEIAKAWSLMCGINNFEKIDARTKTLIDIKNRGYDLYSIVVDAAKNKISNPMPLHCTGQGIFDAVCQNTALSTNEIQISKYLSGELLKPDNVKLTREILHISRSVQPIASIIDLFSENMNVLSNPEILLLLEKYIFLPTLITKAVESELGRLEKLHDFLNLGMLAFSRSEESKISEIALHKIKVKLFIYEKEYYIDQRTVNLKSDDRYAALSYKITECNQKLEGCLKYIETQLQNKISNPGLRASLNYQKVEILASFIDDLPTGKEREETLRRAIETQLRIKGDGVEQLSENLMDADRFAQIARKIQLELSQMKVSDAKYFKSYIEDLMSNVLENNSVFYESILGSGNIVWDVKLPFINLCRNDDHNSLIVSIDLSAGKISRPGLNPAKLPSSILFDNDYIKLFGDYDPVALSDYQGNYFEFDFEKVHYRIQKRDTGALIIWREYDILDFGPRLYQFTDLQSIEGIYPAMRQLPYVAWVAKDIDTKAGLEEFKISEHSVLLICKAADMNPELCYQSQFGKMRKLNDGVRDSGFSVLDKSSKLYDLISDFENPAYIICLESQDTYQIQLVRYNLTLELKKRQTDVCVEPQWHAYIEGTEYELELKNTRDVIPGLRSRLIFSNQKERKVLFPVQPFVLEAELKNATRPEIDNSFESSKMLDPVLKPIEDTEDFSHTQLIDGVISKSNFSGSERTEYYNLTPDIYDYLRLDFYSTEESFDFMHNSGFRRNCLNYDGTCQFTEYKIEHQKLIPSSMSKALYLAYIYLCMNDTAKSFEVLKYGENHFHELSGTEEEFKYLEWIMFATPAKFKASKVNAELQNPDILALKLKALCFAVRFKKDNSQFRVKSSQIQAEDKYVLHMNDRIEKFYTSLENTAYDLYYRYLHTERNVPYELRLEKHEKATLLRSIFMKDKGLLSGPFAVSYRELEVELLQLELKCLEKKENEYNVPPEGLIKQIQDLRHRLTKDKKIEGKISTVGTISVKVKVPSGWNYNRNSKRDGFSLKTLKLDAPVMDISNLLRFPIDEMNLIRSLPNLLDAVYSKTLKESDMELLKRFSEQAIRAYYQESNKGDDVSNVFVFSSYTFIFSNNIDEIRGIENKTKQYLLSKRCVTYEQWLESLNSTLSWISKAIDILEYKQHNENGGYLVENGTDLITTRTVSQMLLQNTVIDEDILISPDLANKSEVRIILENSMPSISSFYVDIEVEDAAHAKIMEELKVSYLRSESIDSFEHRFKAQSKIDGMSGEQIDKFENNKNKIASKHLSSVAVRNEVLKQLKNSISAFEAECSKKLDEILAEANINTTREELADQQVVLRLELLGKKRKHLVFSDLQRLYLNSNLNETMQLTGLTKEKSIALHQKIAEYFDLVVLNQQCLRVTDILSNPLINLDVNSNSPSECHQVIADLGRLLAEKNLISAASNPALMIFQADQNILIRSNQKDIIEALINKATDTREFENKIIQLIMGGGKSKVILPILALKRATGENLSIIEVPEALYRTNFADLSSISLRLFGQRAYGFNFNRQSPCDSASLKKIYRDLKYVSVNRGYVVTTRESMASLELKYHELLSSEPKNANEEWRKQIKWIDRIIAFRTSRADALIDEVDSALDNRRQINYTVGDQQSVPDNHIRFIIELFEFVNQLDPKILDTFMDRESLSMTVIQEKLAQITKGLVYNPASPLYEYMPEDLIESGRESVVKYLLNESESFPTFFNKYMSDDARFTFNLLKGELNHLLPHTLMLKLYENYGPSLNPNKSLIEKCISIPYGGNADPKETSKDTNHLKTINLTIQSVLYYGCSEELLRSLLASWYNMGQSELLENPNLKTIDNTEIGKAINFIFNKSSFKGSLGEIHLHDEREFKETFNFLRMNRPFLFYILREEILPKMQIEAKVLTHNPVNHVCLYRTAQGITGTPWNWRTFHQSLKFDQTLNLGTDGLTIARLRNKIGALKTKVYGLKYNSPSQYLRDIFYQTDTPERVRAIIDVGATFRGVSNFDVASQIACALQEYNIEYKQSLRYVLFFDKNTNSGLDEIYALSVENPKSKPICLTGKSSLEIENLLRCQPNSYFTYYDQRHTIGADIRQDPHAKAIVTVDRLTLKKDFCQGVMRMRGFAGSQSVDVVISSETGNAMKKQEVLEIEHVIESCETNEINRLLSDQFAGALQKIENLITFDLKKRILKIDSTNIEEKKRLHKIFEPLFIRSISDQVIESYGAIEIATDTKRILQQSKRDNFEMWLAMLKQAGIQLTESERIAMSVALDRVISCEVRNCSNTQMLGVQVGLNQTAESKQESQQEAQAYKDQNQNQEQEQELTSRFDLGYNTEAKRLKWIDSIDIENLIAFSSDSMFDNPYDDRQRKVKVAFSMPEFMMNPKAYDSEKKQHLPTSGFDSNIFKSYNFHNTSHSDVSSNFSPEFQKQIHAILMIQTPKGIKSMIITYDEAKSILRLLNKSEVNPPNYVWLINTHQTEFGGTPPDKDSLHPNYKSIMQQLRFYNGNLSYLLEEDLSGSWLMENYQHKMTYFERHILPYRLTDKSKMQLLHKKINSLHEAHLSIFEIEFDRKLIAELRRRYPLLNALNMASLESFQKFHSKIGGSGVSQISNKELDIFIRPYYFRLYIDHGNVTQLKNYVGLIDDSILKTLIEGYLKEFDIKHDYASFLKLYRNPAFYSNQNARQVFEKVLGERFENPEFTTDLFKYAVDEDVFSILSIISLEHRIALIQKLSASTLADIFSKDITYIKNFLDDISVVTLNPSIKVLDPRPVSVVDEEGYERTDRNYNYLISSDAKLSYLLSHFGENYVKRLFSVGDNTAFYELFESAMKAPQHYFEIFKKIFSLIKPTLTEDNHTTLWRYAFRVGSQPGNGLDGKINPIECVASHLPDTSFVSAIRKSTGLFLTLLNSPRAEIYHDYIWKCLNRIESDREKYELITIDLRCSSYPFNHSGSIEVLEKRYHNQPKPDLYYRLLEIKIKYELIDSFGDVLNDSRFTNLDTRIRSYASKMNESRGLISPISELYISDHLGKKSYLHDILKSSMIKVMRVTYFTSDKWMIKPALESYIAMMDACVDVLPSLIDLYIEDDSGTRIYLKDIIQQKCDDVLYSTYQKYFESKTETICIHEERASTTPGFNSYQDKVIKNNRYEDNSLNSSIRQSPKPR
ncbi:MAG: DUF3638 domain-containing protein [Gammaproteobacteria bacterium]